MKGNAGGLSSAPSTFSGNRITPWRRCRLAMTYKFSFQRLNDRKHNLPAGWKYVLPTDAREYACRAGSTTVYSGKHLADNANWNRKRSQSNDVGQYTPNAWGFHDMHGKASMNGRQIGMHHTHRMPKPTQKVLRQPQAGRIEEAHGLLMARICL